MPKYGSPSFSLFQVDGYNMLAAKLQGVTHEIEIELESSDGLGDTWREKTPTGMRTATLEQSGAFFDTSANTIHAAMSGLPATRRLVTWATAGATLGALITGALGAFTSKYSVISSNGKLTKANVTYAVSGQIDEGVIVQDPVAKTADWTGTAVDSGASSPNGGVGYLSVSAFSGFTGAVITIQDSPDNSVWTDLIVFANTTAAPSAQRIEVAGVVDRYVRVNGDVTGSGSITAVVGFARNP